MDSIVKVLMSRDGLTKEQAMKEVSFARKELMEYLNTGDMDGAYNICEEMFGLEPDYLMDLM